MNFTIKPFITLIALVLCTLVAAQSKILKEQNGYKASKANGSIFLLTQSDKLKNNINRTAITDSLQKTASKKIIHAKVDTPDTYEFFGGKAYKGHNVSYASITDKAGNTYVTGGSTNEGQPSGDFFTLKIGSSGEILWEKREPAALYAVEYGTQITFDNSGNIIVSGLKWNGNDMDIRLIKYTIEGEKLWDTTFNNETKGIEIPNSITTDINDNIYITGASWSGNAVDYLTLKYNSNGVKQWHKTENPTGGETWNEATAITVDSNENIIVTGYSPNKEGWLNYHTIKYDSQGTKLWEQGYNYKSIDPNNTSDVTNSIPSAITTDNDNNIYITGTFDTFINLIGTIKYNASGEEQWSKSYKSSDEVTQGWKIGLLNDKLYVAGSHSGGFADDGTILLSYDTDGTQNWVKESTDLIEAAKATLTFDVDNNIIIGSSGMTPGAEEWEQDVAARAYKYSPEGDLLGESAFVISTSTGNASMGAMSGIGTDDNGDVYFSVNSFYTINGNVYETVKSSFANEAPEIKWSAQYANAGSPDATILNSFTDNKGNTISTGSYYSFSNDSLNMNYFIVKHDKEGNIAWNLVYNTENGNPADGIIGRADVNGNIYVGLLPSFEQYSPKFKIIKLSPESTEQWSTEIELHSSNLNVLEPQADGTVFLGGTAYENEDSTNASFLGIKLNVDGSEAWKTYLQGLSNNNIYQISAGKVNNNGQLTLIGSHGSGNFMSRSVDLIALQLNQDGKQNWIIPLNIDGESSFGTDLYISTDDNIYINGYTQNTDSFQERILTAKISNAGQVLWSEIFGEEGQNGRSYTIKPFSNGDLGIVGYSIAINGDIHNNLLKYDADGTLLWNVKSENMRYYNDFYIDGSDKSYILNQEIIDPFPHKIVRTQFPIASLFTIDTNGENTHEESFIGPEYTEFFGKKIIPLPDNKLLLAGNIGEQSFFKGIHFFETEHESKLGLQDDLPTNTKHDILEQNYPNPASKETTIPFTLLNGGKASLSLYNIQGQYIAKIANGIYAKGENNVLFKTNGLVPGIYFYVLESNGFKQARKMIIK